MKSLLPLLLILSIGACRFAEELLHMSPPEVVAWTPGSGSADPENLNTVKIVFSAPMNRNLTEKAFSLTVDGAPVEGVFSWKTGENLSFTPRQGFIAHRLYELYLDSEAEDSWGNSLDSEWRGRFRTGGDDQPPRIVTVSPEDYSTITQPRQHIEYLFSEAVNRQSFREALSVRPALLCVQQWGDDSRSVVLCPLEDYEAGKEYRFTLGTELTDLAGHGLEESCIRVYPVADPGAPRLEELNCLSDGSILSTELLNGGLEKDTVLQGRMNRSLSRGEQSVLLSFSPDIPYETRWSQEGDEFTLIFNDPPQWESFLTMKAGDKSFLLCFDGPGSRPPEPLSLHFCADADHPEADEPRPLFLNGTLGACDSEHAFLDIRIALAEAAVLNISSLLDSLNISSSVLTVKGLGCTEYDMGMTPVPALIPGPGECLYRIRLNTEITGLPGTVVIALEGSLADSRNNVMGERYALTVCQP